MQQDVSDFMRLRLKNVLAGKVRYDVVDAVLADVDDLYAVTLRAQAVEDFIRREQSEKFVQAFVRAGNLAKKAESTAINEALFQTDEEKALFAAFQTAGKTVTEFTSKRDFSGAAEALTALAAPIDAFFDAVMVMDPDENIRNNRLGLLKSIHLLTNQVADFSRIVLG